MSSVVPLRSVLCVGPLKIRNSFFDFTRFRHHGIRHAIITFLNKVYEFVGFFKRLQYIMFYTFYVREKKIKTKKNTNNFYSNYIHADGYCTYMCENRIAESNLGRV